jgi:nicotinate-nucleotide adenylyltransferase
MTMLRIATASDRCERIRAPVRSQILAPEAHLRFPAYAPGMKIGLFGGSFNPPHEAHRAASLLGLKRLGLDRVWWLVTPGNPLKDTRRLPPLAARIEAARKVARHPRIEVTGIEALIGTCYTYQTVFRLVRRCPGVRFVWMMGADNLAGFDRWRNWRGIAALVPIAVIDRGGVLNALASPAAHWLAGARITEDKAKELPLRQPPAMIFLHGMKSRLSSSSLRHEPG